MFEEVLKLFHSGHAVDSFHALQEYNLLQYLFPGSIEALNDDAFKNFVLLAMQSTDDRVRLDKPVTPAFLFSALLWAPVKQDTESNVADGMPYSVALQKAATRVVSQQVKHVSIPRRFTTTMRDIWSLQSRFKHRSGRRAYSVLHHPKFRAAYDFMCLRANAGEIDSEDCRWWTELQEKSDEQQKSALSTPRVKGQGQKGQGRRRRPRKRKHAGKDSSQS